MLVNNQSTGDVDIRLLEGTDFDYNITNGGILKNEMGDCDSCTFKINGAVAENVFVSVLPLVDEMADNNCLY